MASVKQQELDVVEERLFCECGGEMKFNGMELLSSPPQYDHYCEKCNATERTRGVHYPRIAYRKKSVVPA